MTKSHIFVYLTLFVFSFTSASCDNGQYDFIEELQSEETIPFYKDTLIIAHWNIGHFSTGSSFDTKISAEDVETMATSYKSLFYSIDADILGICEYNPTFAANGGKTASIILDNYPYYSIGNKYLYNCNAIFSKAKLFDSKLVFFDYCVQLRYYLLSKLIINNKEIIFVETHLDWNQGSDGSSFRKKQISDLIDAFIEYPYVIICGDMNIASLEELQPFINSGYDLASGGNSGIFKTYPTTRPSSSIDNIITKGFNIISTSIICDSKLSDHCLMVSNISFH